MPDRFTEDEARRIFARAAERQHDDVSKPPGLSLGELQEIARASGIDPAHVAAAVAEVRGGLPEPTPVTFFGVDMEPRASRVIPGEITEDEWVQVVSRLRRQFKSKGVPSAFGRVREWTSGTTSNLHVMAEPVDGGTRVTLETSKANEVRGTKAATIMMALMIGLFGVISLVTGEPVLLAAGLVIAAVFVVMFGVMGLAYRSWSNRRAGEFAALLDQIELVTRSSGDRRSSAGDDASEPEPRLDLDALADTPATDVSPDRRRMRS